MGSGGCRACIQSMMRLKRQPSFVIFHIILLWFLLTLELLSSLPSEEELVITTSQGKVKGTPLNVLSGSVTAFLGIPYAEPPIAGLRFKKPVPKRPWSGLLNANTNPNTCYQYVDSSSPVSSWEEMWNPNSQLSEDCLYLNVWVPSPRPRAADVMVWIFGGGFVSGTASLAVYDGRYLAHVENVIVVSMNYRLGALGFFAWPGSHDVPGNMGLFDQRLALKWVQDNIVAFGGNPRSVTLFGESAGAASVHLHILSPASHALFTRAILQSGSANARWVVLKATEAKRRAAILASNLECPSGNEAKLMNCLRGKQPQEIVEKSLGILTNNILSGCVFLPVVDGDFLTALPEKLIQMGTFKQLPILVGVNKDEGSYFLLYEAPGFSKDTASLITREQFLKGVRISIPETDDMGLEAVVFEYTDWTDENNTTKNRDALVNVAGDCNFVCPLLDFTAKFAGRGNTAYAYLFDQHASNAAWPPWMGVMHGYEIEFVFGIPLKEGSNYNMAEKTLSRNMMHYWANFAKTGNPNEPELRGMQWPNYTPSEQKYITLNANTPGISMKHRAQKCAFWNQFLPKLLLRTGHITESELWKKELDRWNSYMLDWKSKFNDYSSRKDNCTNV
ncbi:cholinesterase-like isoform X1 [Scyliorhinus canicula]|uniref:cholinesterase-like isoform X1 n=1 Tax=Scyliorhinus canicula TaxID=7830 RepID=UPI0018F2E6B5|nr:cholinesterase-like isoform X1 [Scyliorhinus canicula]